MGCFICKMNYTGYLNICQEKSVIFCTDFKKKNKHSGASFEKTSAVFASIF